MTAKAKLAQKRLTLLQLAEKLGNVSKACRMHKVSRSQFYEYKRAFQVHGLDGLIDKPPIPGKEYNSVRPHSSLGYRPPAPEVVQPLTFEPFWFKSARNNTPRFLT